MKKFDLAVVGAGPGGYVAAIRAAQLGMQVALIERYATLGGTCLNVGCIPSKALLDSSELYHSAAINFKKQGILLKGLKLDFKQMVARKDEVVKQICQGITFLMKKNKISVFTGHGSFSGPHHLQIRSDTGTVEHIEATHIILATGSKPATLPSLTIDKKRIITSTEALSLSEVPRHLIIIGGGVIGLEMGSVYARLGTKVSVVEYMNRLIPTMDETMSTELAKVLRPLGFTYYLSHKVTNVASYDKKVSIQAEDSSGKQLALSGDYCLISVGRRPYTDALQLDKAGIELDERGFVPVNSQLQTVQPHIYAIGDVIGGAMLAHKAEEEGILVVEQLIGQRPHIHYHLIPNVVYTWPEVASVGYTEAQLRANKRTYKVGKFPFKALGRAKASGDEDGLVKVLADKATDELLGVHIIGARAADMIAEAVTAMEFRASAEDIARISHAHPTYMEAVKEACLAATDNRALHM